MSDKTSTALPLKEGLRLVRIFHELLGDRFVQQTAGNYRATMRQARDSFDAKLRASTLHPLARGFSDYLALPDDLRLVRDSDVSAALVSLAADAGALLAFRDVWDDGRTGARRRNLASRLRALKQGEHLLTEYRLGSFFQHQGWSVDHRSAQVLPGMDLTVTRAGVAADVECKFIYPWSGQRIYDSDFEHLLNNMALRFEALQPSSFEIKIVCSDRLWREDREWLVDKAFRLALSGGDGARIDGYSLQCRLLPATIHRDDELTEGFQVVREMHPGYHFGFKAAPVSAGSSRLLLSLAVGSEKPDDIIGNLFKVIKEAQKQLRGDKPSIVAVYIPQVIDGTIELNPESPLLERVQNEVDAGKWRKVSALLLFWPNAGWTKGSTVFIGGTTAQFLNLRAEYSFGPGFRLGALPE